MKLLWSVLMFLLLLNVAQAAYINNEAFNQGNEIYLTLNQTTVDNLTCCALNTIFMNVSGHALTFTGGSDKTITNPVWNSDNLTFLLSGSSWLNFTSTMANGSNSYNLTSDGVFIESRNTTSNNVVWFNYTGSGTISITWNSSNGTSSSSPPDTNTTPALSSVTNQTCGAHYCVITFDVNQSNAITRVRYGTTLAMLSGTINQTTGTSRNDNLTSLSNNTLYYYSVWAWNSSNTSKNTNSSIQSFTTGEDYVAPPSITSYSPVSLTPTIDVNALTTFNSGSSQVVQWTWTGATEGAGDGTTNSTATQTWTTIGAKTVTVTCANANGSCGIIQWDVNVVSDGSGGGTDWDYLTGTVNVAGATITTNPDVGSTIGGAYTFGYVFNRSVGTYWINVSKGGYYSNNTQITFDEDHEVWNPVLTGIPIYTTTWWNSKTNDDSLIVHSEGSESVTYRLMFENLTSTVWVLDGITQSETSPNFTISLNSLGVHNLSVYGNTPTGQTQTVLWKLLSVREKSDMGDEVAELNTTWFDTLVNSMNGTSPDFTQFVSALVLPYTTPLGSLFYVFIYLLPLVIIWLRQEKTLIPAGLIGIFGFLLIPMLPAEWRLLAGLCVILTSFGIIYSLFKERG